VSDTYLVDGLAETVEILIDRWGIPHIYAASSRDGYFAQGFNAARDRLWQIDLWRRAGLGRLSEVLGPDYVDRDRAARLFLYRGSMDDEWHAYGCDLDEVLVPFVEGINAYVRLVAQDPGLLPVEFTLLRYSPAEWAPEDVLRIRAHGRYRNLPSEVARAQILHAFGPAAEALRVRLERNTDLVVPDGLDLSVITDDVLHVYKLATGPALLDATAPPAVTSEGSNNWAVGGDRTASGRPILANDPHRALSSPSLRYLVHVSSPDLDIIGGGEPMLPGISFGHNGDIAFGLTVLPVDYEDLYVYELDDAAGTHYRYGSGWEKIEVERQTICVRDQEPVEVILRFTRHGPVVHEQAEGNAAFAVRAAWLEPGMAPYLGAVALLRTQDWDQFQRAAAHWGAPGENLVYADVGGNIGWQPAGRVPVRPNWSGLLPVPGDGRFEWNGFITPSAMPYELNPARQWLATANQFNVAPTQTGGVDLGFEWEPPFRQQRIVEVLGQERHLTIEDAVGLQNDYLCIPAREVTALLTDFSSTDALVQQALDILTHWDGRLELESAAAAVFELWFRKHLRQALFTRSLAGHVPKADLDRAVSAVLRDESTPRDARVDLDLLAAGFAAGSRTQLDPILAATLRETMLELSQRLGPDPSTWHWGALHHAKFEHPLAELDPDIASLALAPRGGGSDTVGNTTYGVDGFQETVGATLRMVLDIGEWDRSVAMNVPGQSGDPRAPHYKDLVATWANDDSVPLLFTREAVETATAQTFVLRPRRPSESPLSQTGARDPNEVLPKYGSG
jgi:penicillin amidase